MRRRVSDPAAAPSVAPRTPPGGRKAETSMTEETPAAAGGMHATLANLVVRYLREYTGRGPMKARSIISGDAAVVIMYDSLTKGEQVLVKHGHEDEVLQIRHTFQNAMKNDLVAAVEKLLERPVVAFMSSNHAHPDYSVEIFMLGPPVPSG